MSEEAPKEKIYDSGLIKVWRDKSRHYLISENGAAVRRTNKKEVAERILSTLEPGKQSDLPHKVLAILATVDEKIVYKRIAKDSDSEVWLLNCGQGNSYYLVPIDGDFKRPLSKDAIRASVENGSLKLSREHSKLMADDFKDLLSRKRSHRKSRAKAKISARKTPVQEKSPLAHSLLAATTSSEKPQKANPRTLGTYQPTPTSKSEVPVVDGKTVETLGEYAPNSRHNGKVSKTSHFVTRCIDFTTRRGYQIAMAHIMNCRTHNHEISVKWSQRGLPVLFVDDTTYTCLERIGIGGRRP